MAKKKSKAKGRVSGAKKEPDWTSIEYIQPLWRHKGKITSAGSPWARFCCTLSNATLCNDGKRVLLRGAANGKAVRVEVEQ